MYLKDKLEDDELDLSMMQLTEIPVKEIEQLGTKVLKLNLSHNLLTSIPANLPLLTHITHLDLSKNQICELPENFGQLAKLRTLDLYANQITKLPVSFAQLKNLKWLDLKENPLVPELLKSAGPCLTKTDCELAAKKVVARLQSIESQLFQEQKKRVEQEERIKRQKAKKEEEERERIRLEKKLAKEKRREEARQRDAEHRSDQNGDDTKQQNGNYSPAKHPAQNGHWEQQRIPPPQTGFSCIGLLMKILLFCLVGSLALGVSLLWLYTDGNLDSNSIQKAVPVIQKDVERTLVLWGDEGHKYYLQAEKYSRPYLQSTTKKISNAYEVSRTKAKEGYSWMEKNYGDSARSTMAHLKELLKRLWAKCEEIGKNALPFLNRVWAQLKPWLEELGRLVIDKSIQLWTYLHKEFPVYVDWVTATGENVYQSVQAALQKMIQAMN